MGTSDRYSDVRRTHQPVKRKRQCIMASDSEWTTIKAKADRAGLGISDYVRRQLLDRPELAPDGNPVPAGQAIPDDLLWEMFECVLVQHGLMKEHHDSNPDLKARFERITSKVARDIGMRKGSE